MISCRVAIFLFMLGSYCGGTKESDWLCVRGCVGVCRCVRTNSLKCFMLKGKDPTGVIPKVGSVRLSLGVVCTSC